MVRRSGVKDKNFNWGVGGGKESAKRIFLRCRTFAGLDGSLRRRKINCLTLFSCVFHHPQHPEKDMNPCRYNDEFKFFLLCFRWERATEVGEWRNTSTARLRGRGNRYIRAWGSIAVCCVHNCLRIAVFPKTLLPLCFLQRFVRKLCSLSLEEFKKRSKQPHQVIDKYGSTVESSIHTDISTCISQTQMGRANCRQRDKTRKQQTKKDRQTHTHHPHTQTDTHTQTHTNTDTHTDTHRQTHTYTHTHTV